MVKIFVGVRQGPSDDTVTFAGSRSESGSSVFPLLAETIGGVFLLFSMLLGRKKLSKIIPTEETTIRSKTKWKFRGQPRPEQREGKNR